MNKKTIIAKNEKHLYKLIKKEIELHGDECDLNHIDVSNVTDMRGMFSRSKFNGDISEWDVSNVKDMSSMFYYSQFNVDLKKWKPYSLEKKDHIFTKSTLENNQPYWANIDCEFIKSAIEIYELNKKLSKELPNNEIREIKIKI